MKTLMINLEALGFTKETGLDGLSLNNVAVSLHWSGEKAVVAVNDKQVFSSESEEEVIAFVKSELNLDEVPVSKNEPVKFTQDLHEVLGYTFHAPQFASDYVRENGVYSFSTVKNGIKVEVTLSTGNNFCMNDYEFPNPNYEVEYVYYDGQEVGLDYVEEDDFELYEAICDLHTQVNPYSQDVKDYTFNCEGRQEDNYAEEITVDYDALDLRNYTVMSCNQK